MAGSWRTWRVLLSALLALCGVFAGDLPLWGQERPQPPPASTTLPADHWAVEAVRRLEALGLADGFFAARDAIPRRTVHRVLIGAAQAAEDQGHPLLSLVRTWIDRLEAELPELREERTDGFRAEGGFVYTGFRTDSGRAGPGWWIHHESTGATPLDDDGKLIAGVGAGGSAGRRIAVHVQPEVSDRVRLRRGELVLAAGGLALSVARSPVGYGYGEESVVLSGDASFDLVQIETPGPFRLPGVLSALGRFSFHTFGSRLAEPRHPGQPYIWGFAGAWQPHTRVAVALHRASIFGGDSVSTPVTLRTFARTLIGHNLLDFENEVVSLHGRWRLPTDGVVPLTLYGEWGAEDAAGSWHDVPGRMIGVYLPLIPGVEGLAVGGEYASFAESCCGNPPWYRHGAHRGGWATARVPLGHSLGGHGTQWSGYARFDLASPAVRVDARAFSRERSRENLYVPGREGRSAGGGISLRWRPVPRAEVSASGTSESGTGWTERSMRFGVTAFF